VDYCCGVSAQEGGGDRREGALPRIRSSPRWRTSTEKVPSGERWIHEIKFDGYRVQLQIQNDAIKVLTRRGNDWTRRFSKIAADAYLINAGSAIIDGEVVVLAADGTTDFSVLQHELRGKSNRLVMIAFDLLNLNGQDLRKLPLIESKAHLKKLIEKTAIQFSESFEVDGKEMFAHACKVGWKGSSPRSATAAIFRGAAETGSRKPAPSARR
jgi:bifunctional non-homologous end joining protein LigD